MDHYDFTSRQAKNHRVEIRRFNGFRICTVTDADKLALWLADGVAREDRRPDSVRAELIAYCKAERIEPPSAERIRRIVDSGIRQADDALIDLVISRLTTEHAAKLDALAGIGAGMSTNKVADDQDDQDELDVLASIKSSPGNVSLTSVLTEIAKLEAVRCVGLPEGLFATISPKVASAWRARASVESPSHLRNHDQSVRLVLLGALVNLRQQEITDALVTPAELDGAQNQRTR